MGELGQWHGGTWPVAWGNLASGMGELGHSACSALAAAWPSAWRTSGGARCTSPGVASEACSPGGGGVLPRSSHWLLRCALHNALAASFPLKRFARLFALLDERVLPEDRDGLDLPLLRELREPRDPEPDDLLPSMLEAAAAAGLRASPAPEGLRASPAPEGLRASLRAIPVGRVSRKRRKRPCSSRLAQSSFAFPIGMPSATRFCTKSDIPSSGSPVAIAAPASWSPAPEGG